MAKDRADRKLKLVRESGFSPIAVLRQLGFQIAEHECQLVRATAKVFRHPWFAGLLEIHLGPDGG